VNGSEQDNAWKPAACNFATQLWTAWKGSGEAVKNSHALLARGTYSENFDACDVAMVLFGTHVVFSGEKYRSQSKENNDNDFSRELKQDFEDDGKDTNQEPVEARAPLYIQVYLVLICHDRDVGGVTTTVKTG
jgi:hypothetical protein